MSNYKFESSKYPKKTLATKAIKNNIGDSSDADT